MVGLGQQHAVHVALLHQGVDELLLLLPLLPHGPHLLQRLLQRGLRRLLGDGATGVKIRLAVIRQLSEHLQQLLVADLQLLDALERHQVLRDDVVGVCGRAAASTRRRDSGDTATGRAVQLLLQQQLHLARQVGNLRLERRLVGGEGLHTLLGRVSLRDSGFALLARAIKALGQVVVAFEGALVVTPQVCDERGLGLDLVHDL